MKLLVLAQTPPPVHGQSVMVQALVDGLPQRGIAVHLVNLRLSRDAADIGRWRPAKIFATIGFALRTIAARFRHGCDTLYYVPAPAKRGALYRDLVLMALCRPWFDGLVLHWHAVGLGAWLNEKATPLERFLARQLLGRAKLALVLASELAEDAAVFKPNRIAILPNSVPDAGPPPEKRRTPAEKAPFNVLFLGLCSYEKGLLDTVDAITMVDRVAPKKFRLTVAGTFAAESDEAAFAQRIASLPVGLVRHVGFADEPTKRALFAEADAFCFPTCYPHEGQPLTLLEAMARDVPIITTRWRAIPGMLPPTHAWLVEPHSVQQISDALRTAADASPPNGALRRHYLARFTPAQHLAALENALLGSAC